VAEKPRFAPSFLRGIDHFNAHEFWEAHEAWEELWLVAETDVEQFLQGLIQVAAAYHHVKRGTLRGAVRLFDAGLARLANFPGDFCGLDRGAVERASRVHREWAAQRLARREDGARLTFDEFPRLVLIDRSAVPDHNNW
jgi:predicted metal-dependent hydrolase